MRGSVLRYPKKLVFLLLNSIVPDVLLSQEEGISFMCVHMRPRERIINFKEKEEKKELENVTSCFGMK